MNIRENHDGESLPVVKGTCSRLGQYLLHEILVDILQKVIKMYKPFWKGLETERISLIINVFICNYCHETTLRNAVFEGKKDNFLVLITFNFLN